MKSNTIKKILGIIFLKYLLGILMNDKNRKLEKDISILVDFTNLYCSSVHKKNEKEVVWFNGTLGNYLNKYGLILCRDCKNTLAHGVAKRILCPYSPKPACKRCPTNCYRSSYREKMKEIMKFSGLLLIKKGRLNYIFKYFF